MKRIISLLILILLLGGSVPAAEVLTLEQFITTAVRNNPSYRISAQAYLIALQDNESAHSLEDWNLVSSGFWSEGGSAPIMSFSPTYSKSLGYSVGLEKYIARTGTAIQLEHSNTRIEADYPPITIPGMDLTPPPKYYLSDISVSIVQPLLKNAWGLATRNALKMSDYSLEIAKIKLSEDWENFIARLRSEYLTWQKCHRNVSLFEEKVKTVQGQLELTRKQKKYGLSEDLDLVQIQQKAEGYKIMLEQAKMACENQGRKILQLMGKAGAAPDQTEPEKFNKNGPMMDRSSALTYLNTGSNVRKTADILVALQETNLETRENAKKMDVSLILSARPNAYSEGFSDSLSQIGEYNEGTVTITASRPLANDQAEAEAEKAKSEHEKSIKEREEIMLNSEIGLTALYTNLKYMDNMLELNENNLKLARARLKLEKNKFDQGRSSVFFVLQAEDDVLAAENNLNETLFGRAEIVNQIKSLTDQYLTEYKDILKL